MTFIEEHEERKGDSYGTVVNPLIDLVAANIMDWREKSIMN